MDFEEILKNYKAKTCIMSVERFSDTSYGNIRIAAGNKAHCDDVEALRQIPFVPDSPYEMYFPQNKNFEDFCYRCAFFGQPLHAYVNLYTMGLWLDMFLVPLNSDEENIGYCIYTYDVSPHANTDALTALSAETSAEVLRTCIKLRGSTDIKSTFDEVISDIGTICDSEHCCVMLLDNEEKKCILLCEKLRDTSSLNSMANYLDDKFYTIAQSWEETLGGSTCIIVKDDEEMDEMQKRNPMWVESLKLAGARSVVLFPLKHSGVLLGYMWAINFKVEDTVKIKETLELSTFFIAAEIANYQLVQKLEVLSSMDMLTGIKNRNKMNSRVDSIVSGKEAFGSSSAIVFADLNGLKRVNDEEGHSTGDNMLKAAAAILQGVFYDSEVYRAGGDEFMVIVPDTNEEELKNRIAQLRKQSESTKNVRFAIGLSFGDNDDDILKAMRLADERMYADKEDYYSAHPELKYR